MSERVQPSVKDAKLIAVFCLFLGAAATLATGQLFGYLGFLPELSQRFGQGVSLGLPLFALGYAIGMVSIGSLAERFGARHIMVMSLLLGGLLSVAIGFSTTLPILLLLRLAEGVVLGGFPPAAFVAANQKVPAQNILFANSAMAFGLLGSAGIAGLFTHLFGPLLHWQLGFIMYGCLLLLAALSAFMQKGIRPGNRKSLSPYKNFRFELRNPELLRSILFGASTMAVFVFVNSTAQRSPHAMFALGIVVVIVLAVLSFSKALIRYRTDSRRLSGLGLILSGVAVITVQPDLVLLALALVCVGATITIPASIQSVVMSAQKSVPSAVAIFTCSLFVGGAAVGMVVTGLLPITATTVVYILDGCVILATGVAVVHYRTYSKVSR